MGVPLLYPWANRLAGHDYMLDGHDIRLPPGPPLVHCEEHGLPIHGLLHASPHWHFNVKDLNPGGNHGGFGRRSMRAVLWMLGGEATRVRPGPLVVARAYDGLDFAPTIFEAAGVTRGGRFPDALARHGFGPLLGRITAEALNEKLAWRSPQTQDREPSCVCGVPSRSPGG